MSDYKSHYPSDLQYVFYSGPRFPHAPVQIMWWLVHCLETTQNYDKTTTELEEEYQVVHDLIPSRYHRAIDRCVKCFLDACDDSKLELAKKILDHLLSQLRDMYPRNVKRHDVRHKDDWRNFVMRFHKEDTLNDWVDIIINGKSERHHCAELGLAAMRGNKKNPSVLWTVLRLFAKNNGSITKTASTPPELKEKLKDQVRRLNHTLRTHFKATTNPIKPYHPTSGWVMKFPISIIAS